MSRPSPATNRSSLRNRAIFLAGVVYGGVAALRATALAHPPTWVAFAIAAVFVWYGTKPRDMDAGPEADRPRQLATFGFSVVLASSVVLEPLPLPTALATFGTAISVVYALRALARTSGPMSVVSKRGHVSLAFSAMACVPSAFALVRVLLSGAGEKRLAAEVPDFPVTFALVPLVCLFFAVGMRATSARLELGTRERTRVALGLTVLFPALGVLAAFSTRAPISAHFRFFAAAEALALTWVLGHGDPVQIARVSRRALALMVFLGPVCGLGAILATSNPGGAPAVTFATGVVVLALSLVVPSLEAPFLPDGGRLTSAVSRAHTALFESEATEAVRAALDHLREATGPRGGSPELWMLTPPRVLTIDAAGYPHARTAELPKSMLDVCTAEPHGVLRTEVLRELEVRRPDLRSLYAWLSDRSALAAVVVAAGGEPEGLLLVPGAARSEPMALEEVIALKRFADTLSAACQGESALERSLGRERVAAERAEHADFRVAKLDHRLSQGESRNVAATSRLARQAHVGVYSTSIRMAYETLERRVHRGAPVAVVAPSGVGVIPYLARAHLGGPRRTAPFVVVDGTASAEHDVSMWKDSETSPLGLADGGMLILSDGAALPLEVQRLVARALLDKKCPWERPEPLDVVIGFVSVREPEALADDGELDPQLFARLGDAGVVPVVFPRLVDRAEDLHAIVADALAREGLRVRGKPVGLDDRAFARLLDHGFEGEDAELTALARRLVANASGDVVGVDDVVAVLGSSA
jgi:transcriptional regulator with AAA-type ATPase domain